MPDLPKLNLVLHAHLPFVRHPEYDAFLEENWLFEAISESYLPLLLMLRRLDKSGIPGKITLTLTPTLCEMLSDHMLLSRYLRRLQGLCELAEKELYRVKTSAPDFFDAALHYHQRFNDLRRYFTEDLGGNLISAFRQYAASGRIEILACAATHAMLPLLENPATVRAQVEEGLKNHEKHFNAQARGFWLPECAFTPEIGRIVAEYGVAYFITDAHAVLHGQPRPKFGVYCPVRDAGGCAVFPRDPESSRQVWSAECGYPGDGLYREFYRDLGWDAPLDYIGNYLVAHDLRHDLGFKYFRVTGQVGLADKQPYTPSAAADRAAEHARHFVESRLAHARLLQEKTGRTPVFTAPYDAELFGHWWYEGPVFIEEIFRNAASAGLELTTPGSCIDSGVILQPQEVCVSSWGYNGYFENWLNGSNDWIYPLLHRAGREMVELARISAPAELERRTLNQAARELMLAQSSDWAFILSTHTMAEYAHRRVSEHLEHFEALRNMLRRGRINEEYLQKLEERNNLFPEMDYRLYGPRRAGGA